MVAASDHSRTAPIMCSAAAPCHALPCALPDSVPTLRSVVVRFSCAPACSIPYVGPRFTRVSQNPAVYKDKYTNNSKWRKREGPEGCKLIHMCKAVSYVQGRQGPAFSKGKMRAGIQWTQSHVRQVSLCAHVSCNAYVQGCDTEGAARQEPAPVGAATVHHMCW